MTRKRCFRCGKPSVPGLVPWVGLCQEHFNLLVHDPGRFVQRAANADDVAAACKKQNDEWRAKYGARVCPGSM